MNLLDLTLPTLAENVALDEALLDEAEAGEFDGETLRFWESPDYGVVLGRSSKSADEARLEECARRGIPVIRRTSGGASIVTGPGCLMYAVILSEQRRPGITGVDVAHRTVLGTLAQALTKIDSRITWQGTSDLAVGKLKFSGNALRVRRSHVLYHGTLLYDFDLDLIPALLDFAPRQPEYRQGRSHREFVGNIQAKPEALREVISADFRANAIRTSRPQNRVNELMAEQYTRDDWNFSR